MESKEIKRVNRDNSPIIHQQIHYRLAVEFFTFEWIISAHISSISSVRLQILHIIPENQQIATQPYIVVRSSIAEYIRLYTEGIGYIEEVQLPERLSKDIRYTQMQGLCISDRRVSYWTMAGSNFWGIWIIGHYAGLTIRDDGDPFHLTDLVKCRLNFSWGDWKIEKYRTSANREFPFL